MKKTLLSLVASSLGLLSVSQAEVKKEHAEKIDVAVKELSASKTKAKRKLLVFSKTCGFHHASIPTGVYAFQKMGEQTGAFEAVVSNDLENFEPEKINEFDAICFLNTTQNVFSLKNKELKKLAEPERQAISVREMRLKKSLIEYIRSGKGFVGIHAATDTFYEWRDYGVMIGGYFDGHPWNANTPVSIMVEKGQEEHACCAHLEGKNMNFKEEIYQFKDPYDARKLHILLRLDPEQTDIKRGKRKDKDYSVSWVKPYGKGRVFYSSLGHNHHIYSNIDVLQHYLKGVQWALGDIDVDVNVEIAD